MTFLRHIPRTTLHLFRPSFPPFYAFPSFRGQRALPLPDDCMGDEELTSRSDVKPTTLFSALHCNGVLAKRSSST